MSEDQPVSLPVDGSGMRFGIVASRYNQALVDALLERVIDALEASGVETDDIETVRVPGSHEIPYTASMLADSWEFDCVIALGVLIGGDTQHHIIVGNSSTLALHTVAIESRVPVINGIVVADTEQQAVERCTGSLDRGLEFARAALEMANLRRDLMERFDYFEDLFEEDDSNAGKFQELLWEQQSDLNEDDPDNGKN